MRPCCNNMNTPITTEEWGENVFVVDTAYVNHLAEEFKPRLSEWVGRELGTADFPIWLESTAFDAGLEPGKNNSNVVLVHPKDQTKLSAFNPDDLTFLDAKAFDGPLGEFVLAAVPVEEQFVNAEELVLEVAETLANHKEVKNITLVFNAQDHTDALRTLRQHTEESKTLNLICAEPLQPEGYTFSNALNAMLDAFGVNPDDIK